MFKTKISFLSLAALLFLSITPAFAVSAEQRLIKSAENSAVYLTEGSTRYSFPDQKTYQSWYGNDFSAVETVSASDLALYQLVGNVTHKPGSLIKIQTDPKVYEVLNDAGDISWVASEQDAVNRFGQNWAALVSDVPVSFFVNYAITTPETPTPDEPPLDEPDNPTPPPPLTFDQTASQPSNESTLVRLTTNSVTDSGSDIAWSGSTYGLVYIRNGGVYYTYVNNQSAVGPASLASLPTLTATAVKIVWDEGLYAIVFAAADEDGNAALYFSKVDPGGSLSVNSKKITNVGSGTAFDFSANDLVSNPGYGLVYEQQTETGATEIYYAKIDDLGVLSGTAKMVSTHSASTDGTDESTNPRIIWDDTNYGIFWKDGRNGNIEIYFMRVEPSGAVVTTEKRITTTTGTTQSPALAWDGTTYAILYFDATTPGYYFQRVYPDGGLALGSPVAVGSSTETAHGADITYFESWYYVAIESLATNSKPDDGNEIYFHRISQTGDTYKTVQVTYNPWPSTAPAIIGNATDDEVGITWTDARATCDGCIYADPNRNEIYFVKLDK